MDADDPQGGLADGQHVRRGIEEGEQRAGHQLKQRKAHGHDAHGHADGQLDGLLHPVGLFGPEVVGDDGHHAVVQAENGHEDEALELEIRAEHGGGGGREGDDDAVDAEDHHGADALHDDGRQADLIDVLDGVPVPANLLDVQVDIRVALDVHDESGDGGAALADDRGDGGTGDLQPGSAEEAEDEDGVQGDVQQGAQHLGAHGEMGPAGRLQQALKRKLAEQADGAAQADPAVAGAVVHDLRHVSLHPEECMGEEDPDETEHSKGAEGQEDAGVGGLVCLVLLLGPQGAGEQGVHTHGGARADGDHQVLQGEGQGDGGQGVLTQPGHEDAVHDVVQRLDQHGDHHGHRHAGQQSADGLNAHFIFRWFYGAGRCSCHSGASL